jgi:hypothetical protein
MDHKEYRVFKVPVAQMAHKEIRAFVIAILLIPLGAI